MTILAITYLLTVTSPLCIKLNETTSLMGDVEISFPNTVLSIKLGPKLRNRKYDSRDHVHSNARVGFCFVNTTPLSYFLF